MISLSKPPKIGDLVMTPSHNTIFEVSAIYPKSNEADLRQIAHYHPEFVQKGVPWEALLFVEVCPPRGPGILRQVQTADL